MNKRILINSLVGGTVVAGLSLPLAHASFSFADYGVLEDGTISSVAPAEGYDYTVTFAEGNATSSDSKTTTLPEAIGFQEGAEFTPEAIETTPAKEGYAFDGYYTDASCTTAYNFYTSVDSDMTLYVAFTPLDSYSYTDSSQNVFTASSSLDLKEDTVDIGGIKVFKYSSSAKNTGDGQYTLNLATTALDDGATYSLQVYGKDKEGRGDVWNSSVFLPSQNDGRVIRSNSKFFTLVLQDDLVISNGSTLQIGGCSSLVGNGIYCDLASDNFALDLNGHNLIVEPGSNLELYGLLTDSTKKGMVVVDSGAYIKVKMSVYNGGGSQLLTASSYYVNPFPFYGFPALDANIRFYAGAEMTAVMSAGTSSQGVVVDVPFIGKPLPADSDETAAMLILESKDANSPGYLDFRHNMIPAPRGSLNAYRVWDTQYREYFSFHDCLMTLGSLAMKVSMASIDSAEFLWELPGNSDITLDNCDLYIDHQFQLNPGLNFYSDKDSNIIFRCNSVDPCGIVAPSKLFSTAVADNISNLGSTTAGHIMADLRGKEQSLITVMGDIRFEYPEGSAKVDQVTFLGGYFNLSDRALASVLAAAEKGQVTLMSKGQLANFHYVNSWSSRWGVASYYVYPLIANGVAYTNDHLDGGLKPLDGKIGSGIYTDGTNYYSYFNVDNERPDDFGEGNFELRKIDYDATTHSYTIAGDDSGQKYAYFAGISVPVYLFQKDGKSWVTMSDMLIDSAASSYDFVITYDEASGGYLLAKTQTYDSGVEDISIAVTLKAGNNCAAVADVQLTEKIGATLNLTQLASKYGFTTTSSEAKNNFEVEVTGGETTSISETTLVIDLNLGLEILESKSITITFNYGGSSGGGGDGCIFADAPVLMADGSTKRADEVKVGDIALAWDFETGRVKANRVFFYEMYEQDIFAVWIQLANGEELRIACPHALFDYSERKFFTVTTENYTSIVGREIAIFNGVDSGLSSTRIVSVRGHRERRVVGNIETAHTLNFFCGGALNADAVYVAKLPFEVGADFAYDRKDVAESISRYGLTKYEVFKDYMNFDNFDCLNGQYVSICIGKGLFTLDYLFEIAKYYLGGK